ncbi:MULTISPECIES: DUF3990 domain-containing protein [unclassified Candidatus Paralachnospira]|uniref:DUF3990 domain-containing protein n=1 Tax=unclassified Candidatus Paralachnospira TaxID=3099471 RepID=UPI003F8E078C
MIGLEDGMLLYHGSYVSIPDIDLSRCMGGLDFGRLFQKPSIEWLHFVAANRKKDLFPQLLKKYSVIDIIGGKIADDQTARTLQIYISGEGAGEPGTPKADKETIEKLLPNRLKDQFCFRTQDAVKHLEFIRSDRYGDIKL